MNRNIKSVMTLKELEIVQAGSRTNVKLHSTPQLKIYMQAARVLRNKYRDLVDLHKGSNRHRPNHKNIEKAHIFEMVLGRYRERYKIDQAAAKLA